MADRAAIPVRFVRFDDANPDRRHAAAQALGWIWPAGMPAARTLIQGILNQSQPQPVRGETAVCGLGPSLRLAKTDARVIV
jgi:hypothetical protein